MLGMVPMGVNLRAVPLRGKFRFAVCLWELTSESELFHFAETSAAGIQNMPTNQV